MTSIRLPDNDARIALLSDVAADLHIPAPRSLRIAIKSRGGVRQYVGGVRRAVTLPGETLVVSLDIPRPQWRDVAELRTWVGQTVLYRDVTSALFYGLLTAVNDVWLTSTPLSQQASDHITITIETTTDTPETLL